MPMLVDHASFVLAVGAALVAIWTGVQRLRGKGH